MQPEQQQRILGYFIEEAKDHLNTIEQGLLNLQATIGNPEMANEIFRAAHSVKGGAAMLGIESMQRTSHRLEDYFKLLKESPIQVDRPLESMFLQVFDALQELLEQLQGPFGLTDEKEQSIMADVEPVFQQLQEHLDQLVSTAEATAVAEDVAPLAAAPAPQPVEESALKLVFSSDVSAALRAMLAHFKQADTDTSRAALEECCHSLERFGEQFNLPSWLNLTTHARWAVCDRNNDYRTLAPVLIKEIKKSQDLVLAGREPEILISDTLQTLAATGSSTDEFDTLFADSALPSATTSPELEDLSILDDSSLDDINDDINLDDINLDDASSLDIGIETGGDDSAISLDDLLNEAATPSGPDVGAAELTSLADLFETSGDALDSDWQEEDLPIADSAVDIDPPLNVDMTPDFEDLLNEGSYSDTSNTPGDLGDGDVLISDLFDDTDPADSASLDSELPPIEEASVDTIASDLEELGSEDILSDLFDDTNPADDASLDSELDNLTSGSLEPADTDLSASLESIDELFDQPPTSDAPDSADQLFGDLSNQTNDDPLSDLGETSQESVFDLPEITDFPADNLDLLSTPATDQSEQTVDHSAPPNLDNTFDLDLDLENDRSSTTRLDDGDPWLSSEDIGDGIPTPAPDDFFAPPSELEASTSEPLASETSTPTPPNPD